MSSRIAPVSRVSPYDQLATTHAPTMPASVSIQSQPSAGQDQADDDQHRYGGVGDDVNSGSAHVVVASRRAACVLMFLKNDGVGSPVNSDIGVESVRLRNFIDGFQKVAAIDERKDLPRSVRSHGFNGHSRGRKFRPGLGLEPEPRRDPILVHVENGFAVSS